LELDDGTDRIWQAMNQLTSLARKLRKANSNNILTLLQQINHSIATNKTSSLEGGRSALHFCLDIINPNQQQNEATCAIIHAFPQHVHHSDVFGGWLPIHKAIKHKFDVSVILCLLSHNNSNNTNKMTLDLRIRDPEHQLPLLRAIKINDSKSVLALLANIEPEAIFDMDDTQRTALHLAARYSTDYNIFLNLAFLLKSFNRDTLTPLQWTEVGTNSTPLHLYLQRRNKPIDEKVIRLLALDPNVMLIKDARGRTPADIAVQNSKGICLSAILIRNKFQFNTRGGQTYPMNNVELNSEFYSTIRGGTFVRKSSGEGLIMLS